MPSDPSRRKRGRPPHPDILTPREWQVLDLLRKDLTNEQIAHRLDISPATAKYHVSEILSKLGVATREDAAVWHPEGVPVHWWQRATAWLPRRAWPLAGATGALTALALLGLLLWAMQNGEEGPAVAQPSPSGNTATTPTLAAPSTTPTVAPTRPPSVPLGVYSIASDGSALQTLLPGFKIRDVTPDGRFIAGAEFCSAPGHLEFVDSQTGITRQLATFDGIVSIIEIAPDGSHLLVGVQSPAHPRTPLLHLVPTGNDPSPVPLFEGGDAEWSPDSRYIRFIDRSITSESTLSLYEVATGAHTTLFSTPYLASAIWSPDSAALAYSTARDSTGALKEALLLDLTTGASQPLHPQGIPVTWFPDGQSVAVLVPAGQNSPLVRVWVDGSRSEPLGESSGFAISPDGTTVARRIFTEAQRTELRITRDGEEIVVGGPAEPAGDMAFSPDSRTVAFIAQEYSRGPGGQIVDGTGVNPYVVAADGSNLRKLADTVQSQVLGWTADGIVLFASVRGTGCEQPFG